MDDAPFAFGCRTWAPCTTWGISPDRCRPTGRTIEEGAAVDISAGREGHFRGCRNARAARVGRFTGAVRPQLSDLRRNSPLRPRRRIAGQKLLELGADVVAATGPRSPTPKSRAAAFGPLDEGEFAMRWTMAPTSRRDHPRQSGARSDVRFPRNQRPAADISMRHSRSPGRRRLWRTHLSTMPSR